MSCTDIAEPAQSVEKPLGSTTITFTPKGTHPPQEPVARDLRRLVPADAGGAADPAADRRDLHEHAAALRPQLREGRPGHVVHTPEVGFELRTEIGPVAR